AALDLEPIKVKLMHVESGEGWSLEKANAVEREYRRFLYLMKTFPTEQAAPLMDVDTFWHYHILDTQKYAVDCQAVFGFFLHHFPYIGLRGEEDLVAHERLGKRMAEIYEMTFGESYIRPATMARDGNTAFSAASGQTAFSAASGKTAFSAVAAKTAFSAAATPKAETAFSAATAATAFSAAASGTAFSAAATQKAATAFSAATAATAFSAAATGTAFSAAAAPVAATAFSAAAAPTAFSAASVAKQDPLFTIRPTLKDVKETVKSE
ncbi:MAG: glycine-rich domain-containing protein, partial [Burkholderiaceae bacterium]